MSFLSLMLGVRRAGVHGGIARAWEQRADQLYTRCDPGPQSEKGIERSAGGTYGVPEKGVAASGGLIIGGSQTGGVVSRAIGPQADDLALGRPRLLYHG